jgi:hypothetical protein
LSLVRTLAEEDHLLEEEVEEEDIYGRRSGQRRPKLRTLMDQLMRWTKFKAYLEIIFPYLNFFCN